MKKISAADLAQIKDRTRLTSKELGEAVGYSDAERTIRALLKGERHGKTYVMSGTAIQSLNYMLALHGLVAAHQEFEANQNPTTEADLDRALVAAVAVLPERLRG